MDKQEALEKFNKYVGSFTNSSRIQDFHGDLRQAYDAVAGRQWQYEKVQKRDEDGKPYTVINVIAPMVYTIAGHEVMNRISVDYVPRTDEPDPAAEADIMSDAAEYVEDRSSFKSQYNLAKGDALICGLGATVQSFDYSDRDIPWGVPVNERKFPGFLMYDTAVRGTGINKGRWAGYVDPVSTEWLKEYLEDNDVDAEQSNTISGQFAGNMDFLNFFRSDDFEDIDFLYHFEFYVNEDIYDIPNPFTDQDLLAYAESDHELWNMVGELVDEYKIDLNASLLSLNKKGYAALKDTIGFIYEYNGGVAPKIKTSRRKGKFYYRAELAQGKCIKCTPSWTQSGFSINFVTGYYDEIRNTLYGVVKAMLPAQRALNESVSDYMSYIESCPKGGEYLETDAVPDLKTFQKTRANEKKVTLLAPGAISGGKMLQKEIPQAPTGLADFITLMMEMLPRTIGLNQEFLGIVTSGDMTNALYGKIVKQAYAVLAHFFDSQREYMRRQGYLFMEAVKLLAENNDGMLMKRLSPGKDEKQYFRAYQDKLAQEYDICIVERPMSEDERQENFNKMMELSAQITQSGGNGSALMMYAIEHYAPIEMEDKEAIAQMFAPQPPPPPDPVQQRLLTTQADLQAAQAAKYAAEAKNEENLGDEAMMADIEQKVAAAVANYAKAGQPQKDPSNLPQPGGSKAIN